MRPRGACLTTLFPGATGLLDPGPYTPTIGCDAQVGLTTSNTLPMWSLIPPIPGTNDTCAQYDASYRIINPFPMNAATRLHNIGVNDAIMLPSSAVGDDSLQDSVIAVR